MSLRSTLLLSTLGAAALLTGCATTAPQGEVIRYQAPNARIAKAVELTVGTNLVFLSGKVPSVIDKSKAPTDPAAYGDMEAQTMSVLQSIEAQLKELNMTMADVIKVQVFMVKDPNKGNKADVAGMNKAFGKFFGTGANQPHLPSRSAFEIAGLNNPNWLVEIEVAAVRGGSKATIK